MLFVSVHTERTSQLSMRTEHVGWSTWMLYCEQNMGHLCTTGRYDGQNSRGYLCLFGLNFQYLTLFNKNVNFLQMQCCLYTCIKQSISLRNVGEPTSGLGVKRDLHVSFGNLVWRQWYPVVAFIYDKPH